MRFIFDLDHTVIDSSHRQATLPCGSLDLDHWIENSTPEKVMLDSLLPLADQWREISDRGGEILVCTARVMQEWDYDFLFRHGLYARAILSRPMGCRLGDGELKEYLLRKFAAEIGETWARFSARAHMFDDNNRVIEHLTPLGIRVYNAISLNERLAA